MIINIFSCGPFNTNVLLIGCSRTKKAVVIDPAYQSAKVLLSAAKKEGLEIISIFLTHSHWDHIADISILKKELSLSVYVHDKDAKNLEQPGSDGLSLPFDFKGVKPDHLLHDGQKISVGDLIFEVIYTPGHTPGGVCFYIKKHNLLISGDTLFKGSIGNISFPTSEPKKMWESLKKLEKLPPETIVIPGHGEKTKIGKESWLPKAKEIFS
jgi:glyoxylase-like metal-dependent hydrolase (beta-lactamase superfamily II)